MGGLFSRRVPKGRLLMLGLDAAGKTTILYRLKLGEVVQTVTTVAFNIETIEHADMSLQIWDYRGHERLRPMWRQQYAGSDGLIFVVDSSNRDRVEDARIELQSTLDADEMRDAVVLVYANKQDVPGAISPGELADKLGLFGLKKSQQWYIQGASAITGDGLLQGMDWLVRTVQEKRTARA